jgi:hypothetical protein
VIRARTLYTHHTRIQLQVSEQNLPAQCELYTALPPHRRLLPHLPLVQRLRLHAHTHTHTHVFDHTLALSAALGAIQSSGHTLVISVDHTHFRSHIGTHFRSRIGTQFRSRIGTHVRSHIGTEQWAGIPVSYHRSLYEQCSWAQWVNAAIFWCVNHPFVVWAVPMSTVSQRNHFLLC